uniref:MD-2-related lipid-recognition domain-containing protein n=1 Tax=Trichuris muris TaxID=70415 RepID=A0A5S6QJ59_TRIMR
MKLFAANTAAILISVAAALCPPPDGTETKLYIKQCDNTEKSSQFRIFNLTITDNNGVTTYPLTIKKPMVVHVDLQNTGSTVHKISSDMTLYVYGKLLWSECSWINVPTFGHLNNISECQNCPIRPGAFKDLRIIYDLSRYQCLQTFLISGLPYAMDIKVFDGTQRSKQLACIRLEAIITK